MVRARKMPIANILATSVRACSEDGKGGWKVVDIKESPEIPFDLDITWTYY
jgi:hypothetical protein